MKFYSGFSLANDRVLFEDFLKESDYTISGFSYGAIKAFKEALDSKSRVDTLQLFSPAFFQDKSEKFKRMQTMFFLKDQASYLANFTASCFAPSLKDPRVNIHAGSAQELDELLGFVWKADELRSLQDRGVQIEVYLGAEDKIINAEAAKAFFLPYATTYMINHAGHTLQSKE